jgi:N-acetylneuraminic acid mutarotase
MRLISIILLSFFIFQACNKNNVPLGKWKLSRIKNLPIKTTNQAVSEGYIKNKSYLYSFGGLDSSKLFSGIHQRSFRYNVKAGIWKEISSLPDSLGKIANAASRINDTIYIVGGYHVFKDGSERSSNKIHRFDIKQNKFLQDGASIPIPIDDHVQAIWRNKLIYVVTGWSDTENVPNVQIYDPKKNAWSEGTPVPNNHIYKSFGASGTIIGDTIYYFGGAAMGKNYPIQNYLRKGVINPKDPTEISWSYTIIDSLITGYRMASLNFKNIPFWFGGSSKTYNYNGIAYDKSGGVEPNQRILSFTNGKFKLEFNKNIPMDLRGIVDIHDSIKYIIGGMDKNQKVTDKVYKLEWK